MSCCNTCQTKFSFFTKEYDCPFCGFSYCSKCLKYEFLESKRKQKICGPCFHNKSKIKKLIPASVEDLPTPNGLDEPLTPFNLETRVEKKSQKHPITVYYNKLDKLSTGLDPADQEIVNRLKRLKNEDKEVTPATESEIRRRLALLRDQDPDVVNKPININQVDTRSNQQKVDDLISQYLEELEISKDVAEKSKQVDDEIEARLKSIKEFTNDLSLPPIDFNQFGASTSNEVRPMDCMDDFQENWFDDENQCCMCDKKKNLVKCKGCHDDLYCNDCFNDNHDEFEMKKHRTQPV